MATAETVLTNVLTMTFTCDDGKKKSLSVYDCKTDLDATAIKAAMNSIIVEDIFELDGGASLTAPAGAKITKQEVSVMF